MKNNKGIRVQARNVSSIFLSPKRSIRVQARNVSSIFLSPKRSQLTIIIILAIVIVVGIVAALYFMGKSSMQAREEVDPASYIGSCARKVVQPSVDTVISNAGMINPQFFISYKDEKYRYLCYEEAPLLTCINQAPMLKEATEEQIRNDTIQNVSACFDSYKNLIESKGYSYSQGDLDYSIRLAPKKVYIYINRDISISRGENSQKFSNFDTVILSPLYDLITVAREIVNQESQYCNFEYNGFMFLYPEYSIKRIYYNDSRIYNVIDRLSDKNFKFAVRGCVIPKIE